MVNLPKTNARNAEERLEEITDAGLVSLVMVLGHETISHDLPSNSFLRLYPDGMEGLMKGRRPTSEYNAFLYVQGRNTFFYYGESNPVDE